MFVYFSIDAAEAIVPYYSIMYQATNLHPMIELNTLMC